MQPATYAKLEATYYSQRVPRVPDGFRPSPAACMGAEEGEFARAFARFAEILRALYVDMGERPGEYGVPELSRDDPKAARENRLTWRAFKRLGEFVGAVGRAGEPSGDALRVPMGDFLAGTKKIAKAAALLERFVDAGFRVSRFTCGKFDKGAEHFEITYAASPLVMRAWKAYAVSAPYCAGDPHEFYYFDYKRVAARDALPADCLARDLGTLAGAARGAHMVALYGALVTGLGLQPHYRDDSLEFFQGKKRLARCIVDFHTLEVRTILKLKEMDRYTELVSALPARLRSAFEGDGCRHCGFQGATEAHCKFRVRWSLDGRSHEACGFGCFEFRDAGEEDVPAMAALMRAEYGFGTSPVTPSAPR